MNDLTAAKLDNGLAKVRLEQLTDPRAPLPGECSQAYLARKAKVSEKTIDRIEKRALAKLTHGVGQIEATEKEIQAALRQLIQS